jgi:hypothetical protein
MGGADGRRQPLRGPWARMSEPVYEGEALGVARTCPPPPLLSSVHADQAALHPGPHRGPPAVRGCWRGAALRPRVLPRAPSHAQGSAGSEGGALRAPRRVRATTTAAAPPPPPSPPTHTHEHSRADTIAPTPAQTPVRTRRRMHSHAHVAGCASRAARAADARVVRTHDPAGARDIRLQRK